MKVKVIKDGKPKVLGDMSAWMLKAPRMMSGVGMERSTSLGVKEQREVNQWKQYCDYRGGLH